LPLYLKASVSSIGAIVEAKPGSPDILLIVVDSLRADALSCYGGSGAETPALDRIASQGALFKDVTAAAPGTTASTASILTSRLPSEHGVTGTLGILREGIPTLAEALRARGYETAGIVSSPLVSRTNGLDRGFATWDEDPDPRFAAIHPEVISAEILRSFGWKLRDEAPGARVMIDRALRFLAAPRSAPRFLYLGLIDPRGFKPGTLGGILRGEIAMSADDLREARKLYGEKVAVLDGEVGRLLKSLEGGAASGDLLVVVTSDHGEEFMDHGSLGHGHALYEETLRVPLLISRPGSVPQGSVIHEAVSLLDVAPTILDLAQLPREESFSGLSLHPLLSRGTDQEPRKDPIAAELDVIGYHTSHRWMRAARRGDRKVILTAKDVLGLGGWDREAYDLATDPLERTRLAVLPAEAKELLTWLEERIRNEPPESDPIGRADSERERRLRALGYAE
jgi:arylsulfatase A-like enzyme